MGELFAVLVISVQDRRGGASVLDMRPMRLREKIMFSYERYAGAADFLRTAIGPVPDTALVLGSGLSCLAKTMEVGRRIPYVQIPGFPRPTNPSHAGELLCGTLAGRNVLVFSGRTHVYEGYTMAEVSFYVTVLGLLSVRRMLITNAAGAVNREFTPGDIMLITDHVKLSGESPATGPLDERLGPLFFDMSAAYSPALCQSAREAAARLSLPLREGVYLYCAGPQYETPAEIRAFRALGADAVGMSTVPEVIAAARAGIEVLGFSLLTNMAAGISDVPLSDREVVETAERSGERLAALIREILRNG